MIVSKKVFGVPSLNVAVPFEVAVPLLKGAMRQIANGISVITAGIGDERNGLTVTSAVSLSMTQAWGASKGRPAMREPAGAPSQPALSRSMIPSPRSTAKSKNPSNGTATRSSSAPFAP
jgi:hypothetical protein